MPRPVLTKYRIFCLRRFISDVHTKLKVCSHINSRDFCVFPKFEKSSFLTSFANFTLVSLISVQNLRFVVSAFLKNITGVTKFKNKSGALGNAPL